MFDIINQVKEFGSSLQKFLELVDDVTNLIDPKFRSVVKNAEFLSKDGGCIAPSVKFTADIYEELSDEIRSNVTLDNFNPCDYIGDIQAALNFTPILQPATSFTELVTVPPELEAKLINIFGDELEFTGEWLLNQFGSTSVSKLLAFIGNNFIMDNSMSETELAPNRRRLKSGGAIPHHHKSEAMKRGSVMRAVRHADAPPAIISRPRHLEETPLITLPLFDNLLTLTFSFNFGNGQKSLSFGIDLLFDSDDTASGSIEELFKTFLNETVSGSNDVKLGDDFSFVDAATDLARDLINSLVIDAKVNVGLAARLDLNPVFNSSLSGLERLPKPALELEEFQVDGKFGINEWTTILPISPPLEAFEVFVSEARALVGISASIPNAPLVIASREDFKSFISPNDTDSGIDFEMSLDVNLPLFVNVKGVGGVGGTIGYYDDNILDSERSNVTFETDVFIEIQLIKDAVMKLNEVTSILGEAKFLSEKIPLIQTSANELVAGTDRTIVDLLDLRDVSV